MQKFSLGFLLVTLSLVGFAQDTYTILGSVYDHEGNKLPFSTVYQEGTTNGTTCNAEGNFQLKVSAGSHQISARYVGFAKQTKTINVTKSLGLDFRLSEETLLLQEVIISSNTKNPAYRIIRETIKKRKYYEKEYNAYFCKVYVKGLQRLDKRPSSILGMAVPVDTGIIYLSESLSEVKFKQPDKFSEELIASKVSGASNGFSYNRASEMMINLYQNSFFIEGLSERSFISPISGNAFISYDYKLDGVIYQDSLRINKIKVIPRRSTDPTFSGHLYIVEDSWRLHSVDVMLTKANGIDFVDSLRVNQIFSPAAHGIWMPISQNFSYTFKAFGFTGSGRFVSNFSQYEIEPNYDLIAKYQQKQTQVADDLPKIELFHKSDFGNAILKVKESANKKDEVFWQEIRPVPLSTIEVKDYRIKDSIQVIKKTKTYKDSVDNISNKFRIANLVFGGYTYRKSYNDFLINFPTVLEFFQYNTVEGFAPALNFRFRKNDGRIPQWELNPAIKYGFSNEQFQAKISGFKTLDYKNWEFIYAGAGRYTSHFNSLQPIASNTNTFVTLVYGDNWAKLYQNNFGFIGYQKEIFENVRINAKVELASRSTMENTSSFSLNRSPDFTDNLSQYDFGNGNKISTIDIQVVLRPGRKYIDRPKNKFYLDSKYPEVSFNYKKGIPLFGNNDFDQVRILSDYSFRLGLLGESKVAVEAGTFLNQKQLTFIDHKHFNGNQTLLRNPLKQNSFQLLPYYDFSTTSEYFQAHYEHHFNEFIFNKIPLIKRLNLQGVLSVNFLSTENLSSYTELGFGIEHIFKFLRIDYYSSFNEGKFIDHGITFGVGF
ncbi:MAG: DUF5686 and carboxypeptidase regulatory-like domain-containing protein [Cyclobacteriaceae bacterium]